MFDVISELFSSRNEDKQFITYSGDYDFFIETMVEGELPFQSASISLKCYRNNLKQQYLSTEVKWYRIFDGKTSEILEADGSEILNLSPYDIGCFIMASVRSNGELSRGVAHLTFGPIFLDPAMKPLIENRLLSSMGSYNFSLMKHGDSQINDTTDYSNKIEFLESMLGIQFGENYKEYEDFKVDLFASKGFQIRTVQYDNRVVCVYFRKGEEEMISASVLQAQQHNARNQEGLPIKSQIGMTNMLSFENDGRSAFINKGGEGNELLLLLTDQEFNLSRQNLFEIVIRFESRCLRDDFITSLRFMRIKSQLPLQTIINQCDSILRKVWFPPLTENRDPEYITGTLELDGYR